MSMVHARYFLYVLIFSPTFIIFFKVQTRGRVAKHSTMNPHLPLTLYLDLPLVNILVHLHYLFHPTHVHVHSNIFQ